MPLKKIHVHIIQTAMNDGSFAFTTPKTADILAMLQAANNIYKTAEIEFVYEPSDFEVINSTRLQQDIPEGEDPGGIEIARQTLAGWWYGKLVIFSSAISK